MFQFNRLWHYYSGVMAAALYSIQCLRFPINKRHFLIVCLQRQARALPFFRENSTNKDNALSQGTLLTEQKLTMFAEAKMGLLPIFTNDAKSPTPRQSRRHAIGRGKVACKNAKDRCVFWQDDDAMPAITWKPQQSTTAMESRRRSDYQQCLLE